ncbi:MAG: hypothetical protein GY935_19410 [Gammaproteobacteria bacterium]|nr:hypothetical protein [Gammaproteobacteria bacterium]
MVSPEVQDICGIDRFHSLWQRCLLVAMPDHSVAIHKQLLYAYNEPQRHYHTLAHIEHCLGMFDSCESLVDNPDALEIAVWFHDVIYEPEKSDNEANSAELYLELSEGVHATELRQLVARLIIATLHDGSPLEDSDARYMIDIDLSSFGLAWEEFERDSQNLRAEKPGLSDADYYHKLADFRSKLLSRDRFFYTEFFCQRYEQQVQDNLSRYFKSIPET